MLSALPVNAIKKLLLFNKKTKNLPAPEISLSKPVQHRTNVVNKNLFDISHS